MLKSMSKMYIVVLGSKHRPTQFFSGFKGARCHSMGSVTDHQPESVETSFVQTGCYLRFYCD